MADEAPSNKKSSKDEAPKTGPNGEKLREDGAYEVAPGLWRKDN